MAALNGPQNEYVFLGDQSRHLLKGVLSYDNAIAFSTHQEDSALAF